MRQRIPDDCTGDCVRIFYLLYNINSVGPLSAFIYAYAESAAYSFSVTQEQRSVLKVVGYAELVPFWGSPQWDPGAKSWRERGAEPPC